MRACMYLSGMVSNIIWNGDGFTVLPHSEDHCLSLVDLIAVGRELFPLEMRWDTTLPSIQATIKPYNNVEVIVSFFFGIVRLGRAALGLGRAVHRPV